MPDAVEQPTVPEEAIEAAARAMVMAQSNGCCDQWPKPCAHCDCFRDQRPDVMAGYERAHAHAALAAAVPVIEKRLRARLADEIEAQEKPPDVEGGRVMGWLIGRSDAARIVRGEQP